MKGKFSVPVIEDLLDELHGAKYFSMSELTSGYHQTSMFEPNIPKINFREHHGHYVF